MNQVTAAQSPIAKHAEPMQDLIEKFHGDKRLYVRLCVERLSASLANKEDRVRALEIFRHSISEIDRDDLKLQRPRQCLEGKLDGFAWFCFRTFSDYASVVLHEGKDRLKGKGPPIKFKSRKFRRLNQVREPNEEEVLFGVLFAPSAKCAVSFHFPSSAIAQLEISPRLGKKLVAAELIACLQSGPKSVVMNQLLNRLSFTDRSRDLFLSDFTAYWSEDRMDRLDLTLEDGDVCRVHSGRFCIISVAVARFASKGVPSSV